MIVRGANRSLLGGDFGVRQAQAWVAAVMLAAAWQGPSWLGQAARAEEIEITVAATPLPRQAREAMAEYEEQVAAIRRRATEEVNDRRAQMLARLRALQDEYTRAADLDAAVAVRDEIRRLTAEQSASSCLHGDVQFTAVRRIIEDPGTMSEYAARIGETFLVRVVGRNDGAVWGVDAYTHDSDLSTAALHAGVVREGEQAVLRVTISKGPTQFDGCTRNGIMSSRWDNTGGHYSAYRLQPLEGSATAPAVSVVPLNLSSYRGREGMVVEAVLVGSTGGGLWGTDVYTDDSDPATAAVHAGVLAVGQRGTVKITIMSGRDRYTGSTRNGVTSGDWDGFGGSFRVDPPTTGRRR